MKEKDVIVDKIRRIICEHSDRRIVLYGTGNVTRWIIDSYNMDKKYAVDDIMDFNYPEETFMGFKVISKDNINRITKDDLIIIMNRNPVISQFIYNRIWRFLPEGVFVLGLDGNGFEEPDENEKDKHDSKVLSFEDVKKKIDDADIISFDIFDTLLVRCVEKPIDVFLLMSECVKKKYGICNFQELRSEAEICANKMYISPVMNEIYEKLCELAGIDNGKAQELVQDEIKAESAILSLREKNIQLLDYCLETHKEVFLISDTYYTTDIFIYFFGINGIDLLSLVDKDHILLSCELRKTKENGEMWKHYVGLTNGSKCLHFGDNVITDIRLSKEIGIDSVCTYSPGDLRRDIMPGVIFNNTNALTSVQLGLFNSLVFNSPYLRGTEIRSHYDYGYIVLGPLIFNYLYWILREETFRTDSSNRKRIYFLARDGYFLVRLFNQLSSALGKEARGVYLYTSRAFLKYICYTKGTKEKTGFIGTLKDYLKYRFNYDVSVESIGQYVDADDYTDEVLAPYLEKILKRQALSQSLYDVYLNGIGITRGDENVSIVDPTYNGTCQYYLSKYANIKTKGYYCVANLSFDNKYIGDNCRMKGFYQKTDDIKAEKSLINKYTLVFESSIMVSPEGSMIDIDKNGFVFTPTGKTQAMFELKEETYRGISEYFSKMCEIIIEFDLFDQEPDNLLPQKIFATCIEGKIKVSNEVKQSLYADDYYNQVTDYNVAWQ